MTYDKETAERLVAEALEDDERMTPGQWRASEVTVFDSPSPYAALVGPAKPHLAGHEGVTTPNATLTPSLALATTYGLRQSSSPPRPLSSSNSALPTTSNCRAMSG